jgi:hypothetical protein
MTLMCAWCKKILLQTKTESDEGISHGICKDCMKELKEAEEDVLNRRIEECTKLN